MTERGKASQLPLFGLEQSIVLPRCWVAAWQRSAASTNWPTSLPPPASTHPFIVVSLHAQSGETSNCPNVSRASLGRFSSSGQTSSHRAVLRPSAVFIWEVSFNQFVVYRLGFSAGSSICLCMDRDHHSGSVNHSASEYKPNLVRANWRTSKKTWTIIIPPSPTNSQKKCFYLFSQYFFS